MRISGSSRSQDRRTVVNMVLKIVGFRRQRWMLSSINVYRRAPLALRKSKVVFEKLTSGLSRTKVPMGCYGPMSGERVADDDVENAVSINVPGDSAYGGWLEGPRVGFGQRDAITGEFLSDVGHPGARLLGDISELRGYLHGQFGLLKRPEKQVLYFLGHLLCLASFRRCQDDLIVHRYTIKYYCH